MAGAVNHIVNTHKGWLSSLLLAGGCLRGAFVFHTKKYINEADHMNYEVITSCDTEIQAYNMLGEAAESFTPFCVRCPRLLELNDKTLVYFFDAKYDSQLDEAPSCQIIMRSPDGGQTWSEARTMTDPEIPYTIGGAPVYDEANDNLIFFGRTRHWRPGKEENRPLSEQDQLHGKGAERFWISESTDGGLHWSPYQEIFIENTLENWTIQHCPTPGTGIQLKHQKDHRKNGRLIVPCNHAQTVDNAPVWGAHLMYSDDFGKTWQMGGVIDYVGANESAITELADGTLVYNCRNQGGVPANLRIQGFSTDGGETFFDQTTIDTLPDPICHAGFAGTVVGGKQYIFLAAPSGELNPESLCFGQPIRWGNRERLILYASADGGKTYKAILQLCEKGEFAAYSALLAASDGRLLCAWESGPSIGMYKDIACKVLDLKELAKLC